MGTEQAHHRSAWGVVSRSGLDSMYCAAGDDPQNTALPKCRSDLSANLSGVVTVLF